MNFSRVQYFCFVSVIYYVCYLLSCSTVPSSESPPTISTKTEKATTKTATTTRVTITSDKITKGKICNGKRKMWSSVSWNGFYNFLQKNIIFHFPTSVFISSLYLYDQIKRHDWIFSGSLITDILILTKTTLHSLLLCSLLSFTVSTLFKSSSATTAQGTLSNKCKFKLKNSSFDDRFSLLCLQL